MTIKTITNEFEISVDRSSTPKSEGEGTHQLQVEFSALHSSPLDHYSDLYQSWLQLFQNDKCAAMQQHPDYVLRMASIISKNESTPSAYLMHCRINGKLIATGIFLPKRLSTKALKGLGPVRFLQGYFLCGNRFLLAPEVEHDEDLLIRLVELSVNFCQKQKQSFLLLEDLRVDEPLGKITQQKNQHYSIYSHTEFQDRSLIQFTANPLDYWNQFRSKSLRKHKRLLRKNSDMQIVKISEPDQIAYFLEAAHQISLNTWQTQRLGLRIKNDEEELEQMMFMAMNGWLRSYLLLKDDKPVAFKVGYQHQNVFHDVEIGFDLNYSSVSPGETLLLLILNDMIENDTPHTFDFGGGDAEYKQRFSSEITRSRSVCLFPSTFKNNLLAFHLKSSRLIDLGMRETLKATGVYTAIRQLARYGKLGSR